MVCIFPSLDYKLQVRLSPEPFSTHSRNWTHIYWIIEYVADMNFTFITWVKKYYSFKNLPATDNLFPDCTCLLAGNSVLIMVQRSFYLFWDVLRTLRVLLLQNIYGRVWCSSIYIGYNKYYDSRNQYASWN